MSPTHRKTFHLSESKRALLGARLRREGVATEGDSIVRDTSGLPAPLSSAQERLWFLEQLEPGTSVYNVFGAVRLSGPLDRAALERTFEEIVRRHEALRTKVSSNGGTPLQRVAENVDAKPRVVDLRDFPTATRDAEVARLAAVESRRPFDLECGPLLRTTLVQLADDEHALFVAMHHIVSDEASVNVFVGEMATLYRSFREGLPSPLPELPIQYSDYARWQRRRVDSLDVDLAWWKDRLRDLPPELPLPFDRPREAQAPSHRGARIRFALSPESSRAIHAQCRREGVTPFMWLLAAFHALLHRSTGEDNVAVGSPVSNRSRRETEPLVGLFVNTIVLRVDLSGRPSFRELVARVREVALGALAHQELPFDRLVDALRPPRSRGRHPLFQTMFTFTSALAEGDRENMDGLRIVPFEVESETARFDLAMIVRDDEGAFSGEVEYDTDRFDRSTVLRLVTAYEAIVDAAAADPGRRFDEIALDELPRAPRATVAQIPRIDSTLERSADDEPRDGVETRVARIWRSALGVEPIGRGVSFFDAGGHSLLAVHVIARVREEFGVDVPLRALFDDPTVAGLGRAIESTTAAPLPRIVAAPRSGVRESFPLSWAQQRLWFLSQLEPESAAYNLAGAVRLRGDLDVDALERAIAEVVRRHEALRTTFATDDGSPVQWVHAGFAPRLAIVDVAGAPSDANAWIAEESRRPFDLEAGPLVRTSLLRLSEREHVLVYVMHHIVSDGASMGVLVRELGALYSAFHAGEPSPLPDLPIQYADVALWQRSQEGTLARQLAHWKERLASAPASLDLPTDRPRPSAPTFRSVAASITLPRAISDALLDLGRGENATLFMTLSAAWKMLLSRLSGQADVVVGAPIANRTRAETEGLIGFFVNTLALRTDLSDRPRFRDLVRRERDVAVDAFAHADVPFERIVEELHPKRDLGRTPIVQIFFNWLDGSAPTLSLQGLEVESVDDGSVGDSKFDLTLYAADGEDGVHFRLVGSADLFDERRLEVMLDQLACLLEQAVATPDETIDRFSLVTPATRALLPDPTRPIDRSWEGGVVERFLEQARRAPDREAVRDARCTWSYGELRARSAAIAAWLRSHVTAKEDVVAIWGHRSAPLVSAILGTLEAGAAVWVLDPAHPAVRLAACVRLARPCAMLEIAEAGNVPSEIADALEAVGCRARRTLARDMGFRSHADSSNIEVVPDDLATLVFTSGTTGVPKGILGTHAPLDHFVSWHARTFALGAADRFALLSGLSHDPLFRDTLAPLSLGATLCIPDADVVATPSRLAAWMRRERVGVAHLTPGLGRVLMAGLEDSGATLPKLRFAFFAGDVLDRGSVARLSALAPRVTCVNFYGATETPQAIAFHVASFDDVGRDRVPLGRGIEGVDLLVLGDSGEPCGVGELGEIVVRTPYLARGYRGDDALTRERFVHNARTRLADDRLYRTGDLGRHLPNGEIEFAGRRDRQIKVRGHRVELGDVEAALDDDASVRDAIVVAREGRDGDVELTAYVVARPGATPTATALRSALRSRLPDAMIPSRFVLLDAIPLTPNGKPDVRALPPPVDDATPAHRSARGPIEKIVGEIFADVLGRLRIDADADFFEMGGHSLLATRVLTRVRRAFRVDLPLRAIFESPTVERLAKRIADASSDGPQADAPPIRRVSRSTPIPLSFAQRRLWFLDRLDPESPAYNVFSAVRLRGRLDVPALERALDEIVRRHESLHTTFRVIDGTPVQEIASDPTATLAIVDLRSHPAAAGEARRFAEDDARRPFDLMHGPLLRVRLLRIADEEHVVAVTMHHAITDAASMEIFFRELSTAYAAIVAGRPSPLPDLPIQYADFSAWQRNALSGDLRDRQIAYWRDRLYGAPPVLDLPSDRPRPSTRSQRGATVRASIDVALAERLRALGRREGTTLFMTLLAAFQAFLHRVTGQDDVVIGTPVANRSRAELEGLVGFFANTLVLRGDLGGDPTFVEQLARVRETALGAYAHADLPFEQLVEDLQPARSRSHHPLFQVMFVLQEATREDTGASDLRVTPFEGLGEAPFDRGTARFDWTLAVTDTGSELLASLEVAADLFDRATAARMLESFTLFLDGAAATPSAKVSRLPILSDAERRKILVEWNDTTREFPSEASLHALFEAQVDRTPDAIALVFEHTSLTYRELDRRANRLAHRLHALGVGPESRVAIALPRSLEMVVALLATLKAGGAYVPLDPAYPAERLGFMLEDSGAAVLVTDSSLADTLPSHRASIVCLDADHNVIERESDARPTSPLAAGNLAYVIYTSGST
ncbi:MAG: amino acid adenylation domain-containing protein, partial [Planctomycetes bacterium]|nr:amino acid adenylation domain-containing protein [Planctomycetota bacterium]